MAALGPARQAGPVANTNVLIELDGRPGEPFEVPVEDDAGRVSTIRIDGSRLTDLAVVADGSNNLLAYCARQITRILEGRGEKTEVDIVAWKSIDDESA